MSVKMTFTCSLDTALKLMELLVGLESDNDQPYKGQSMHRESKREWRCRFVADLAQLGLSPRIYHPLARAAGVISRQPKQGQSREAEWVKRVNSSFRDCNGNLVSLDEWLSLIYTEGTDGKNRVLEIPNLGFKAYNSLFHIGREKYSDNQQAELVSDQKKTSHA